MKHALVTGHRGYIGTHLVRALKATGFHVAGVDAGYFDGCAWEPCTRPDREWTADVRSIRAADLEGVDVVCHLAAISNDPMGALDPALTDSVNRGGTVHVARMAKQAGVRQFLFSSSCSVYGKVTGDADEGAPLDPLSAYARSKVDAEHELADMADRTFSPVYLRNATAFGHSANLRIDLVANNLLASALALDEIRVLTDGSPWRPLVHCADIARAFVAIALAPVEHTHNLAINIGSSDLNVQVRDVADAVHRLVPSARLRFSSAAQPDPRDYRVSFSRFRALFPEFRLRYGLEAGLRELRQRYRTHGFSRDDFYGPRFVRLRTLQQRLRDPAATGSACAGQSPPMTAVAST